MVLGKLPVPGRPTIWITVGQGPTALAVGAGGVIRTFLLSSILSFLFLLLFGRHTCQLSEIFMGETARESTFLTHFFDD